MNVTRTFHADSGHGWLAVPHADLDALGLGELRVDSHYDDAFVYLEEDEDTGIYLHAAEQAGWTVDMKTEQIWADSFIRELPGREAQRPRVGEQKKVKGRVSLHLNGR